MSEVSFMRVLHNIYHAISFNRKAANYQMTMAKLIIIAFDIRMTIDCFADTFNHIIYM